MDINKLTINRLSKKEVVDFVKVHVTERNIEHALYNLKKGSPKHYGQLVKPLKITNTKISKVLLLKRINELPNIHMFNEVFIALFASFSMNLAVHDDSMAKDMESEQEMFENVLFHKQVLDLDKSFVLRTFNLAEDAYTDEAYQAVLTKSFARMEEVESKMKANMDLEKLKRFDEMLEHFKELEKEWKGEVEALNERLKTQKQEYEQRLKAQEQQYQEKRGRALYDLLKLNQTPFSSDTITNADPKTLSTLLSKLTKESARLHLESDHQVLLENTIRSYIIIKLFQEGQK